MYRIRPVLELALVACFALLLCGCPEVQPAVDGAPDAGAPDAGPDLRRPEDARLPDRYVYDPDHRLFDIGCQTRLVAVASTGKHFNGQSSTPSISRNGRVVAFLSQTTRLVPGGLLQTYAHDLVTSRTELVSQSSGGVPANAETFVTPWAVSGDGRYVVFNSQATNLVSQKIIHLAVFLRDRQAGTTTLVAHGLTGISPGCGKATISDDGRKISFYSGANDLVPGDTNDESDIFVKDLDSGKIVRVSVADDGSQGNKATHSDNQISGNGQRVVFRSQSQLTTEALPQYHAAIYVRDLVKKRTYLVSRTEDGKLAWGLQPSISADGKRVVFHRSKDFNIYLADVDQGKVTRVSSTTGGQVVPYPPCWKPAISGNGRYVSFCSASSEIVAGDTNGATDIFLVDLQAGTTVRVSVASDGSQGLGMSSVDSDSSVADSGRVAFESVFYNLVGPRKGTLSDVYVRPGCP
jgi:Tol biopolymer transport system component